MTETLIIRVDAAERTRKETAEAIEALEHGESVEDQHVLDLESVAALARLVSETNLALLRAIAQHNPESMRETAALVDRDFKEVHRNLSELEDFGVIEFEQSGRTRRPIVKFDELEIDISMGVDEDSTDRTAIA